MRLNAFLFARPPLAVLLLLAALSIGSARCVIPPWKALATPIKKLGKIR